MSCLEHVTGHRVPMSDEVYSRIGSGPCQGFLASLRSGRRVDVDSVCPCSYEDPGCLPSRRSGGEDVVDQQHRPALGPGPGSQGEGSPDVCAAPGPTQAALRWGVSHLPKPEPKRPVRCSCQFAGHEGRLVELSFQKTLGVKRNWDHRIGDELAEEARIGFDEKARQSEGGLSLGPVFHQENHGF